MFREGCKHIFHLIDLLGSNADYHVSSPQPRLVGRSSGIYLDDQDARVRGQVIPSCQGFVECCPVDSQPGSNYPALLKQLLHHPFDRVDGDRESYALAYGIIAVFIPITLPLISAKGPPLFPGLMAVSVWIRPSKMKSAPGRVLPRALTTPRDTVGAPWNPSVFPIASANCPTLSLSESPSEAAGRLSASILTTAMSVEGSDPTTSPTNERPSLR